VVRSHPSLSIGEFSRAAHLSVKTLRHYHQIGLLEPVEVDPDTGYRRYAIDQIPTAQIIRRFRDLDMPLEEIRAVLAAADVRTRNDLIAAHLRRLEEGLARTQNAVSSLRDLLEAPSPSASFDIGHRGVAAAPAAAISEVVDLEDALTWHEGALGELYATLAAQDVLAAGPAGGIFSNDLFAYERGRATVFIPYVGTARPVGRVTTLVVPGVELATTVHVGAHTDIDRAYGALAGHVAQHALAVDGPIREYYLIGRHDTADESQWRTEVCWPIFRTTTGSRRSS
jgi:DNA-binding transcriptional MerR regulator